MMINEDHLHHHHAQQWPKPLNLTAEINPITSSSLSPPQSNGFNLSTRHSPTYYDAVLSSLRRYLLSSKCDHDAHGGEVEFSVGGCDDEFFMYEFKVKKCTKARAHDWTECPFVHLGEKARRRDPRRYSYSGTTCSDFRKGNCRKGDGCEFAHGVFESWLHPDRFRTQVCKDGPGCKRRVCFFAHSPDQLRASSDLSSPRSPDGFGDLAGSLRNLQLNKVKSMPATSWNSGRIGGSMSPVFGSPRGLGTGLGSAMSRAGFFSLPTTPTRPVVGFWDNIKDVEEAEPVMERVESGRELRAKMFEKLSMENPLNGSAQLIGIESGPRPDFGWVSDLVE